MFNNAKMRKLMQTIKEFEGVEPVLEIRSRFLYDDQPNNYKVYYRLYRDGEQVVQDGPISLTGQPTDLVQQYADILKTQYETIINNGEYLKKDENKLNKLINDLNGIK